MAACAGPLDLADDPNFVFHAGRRTRATRMVDAEVNVFVIQEWRGRKVIDTTRLHARIRPQNLADALATVGTYPRLMAEKSGISAIVDVPHPGSGGSEERGFSGTA